MFEGGEDKYQALSAWLTHRLDSWRNHRDGNYLTKWDEYYRIWRGIWTIEDRNRDSEKSRLISPALQQAVESSVAELEEATFGRGKWFDIKDDVLDNDTSEAERIRNLLQEDLEMNGVKDSICEVFLNGAIYGTGIGKIIVEENQRVTPVEAPVEGTLTTQRTLQESIDVDVRVEAISPKEFLIDPAAESIQEALGVAHEVVKPRYVINQGIKDPHFLALTLEGKLYRLDSNTRWTIGPYSGPWYNTKDGKEYYFGCAVSKVTKTKELNGPNRKKMNSLVCRR